MKKYPLIIIFLAFMTAAQLYLPANAPGQGGTDAGDAPFSVSRFVIAGSVENLEPVGVVNIFASSTEKVYSFLEANDISEDTTVTFVWYYGEKEMARVELPLREGPRWRTYSSKRLGGLKGDWRVELRDAGGDVLQEVEFYVE